MTKYFYNPVAVRNNLIDNLNKMLTSNNESIESSGISNFAPSASTREGEFAYHIELDIPGVKKEEISINNDNNVLTVSGERKFQKELKHESYYKLESAYGKFNRSFSLPKDIDIEHIEAKYSDGVLEIVIPKMVKTESKKIEIK